MLGHADAGLGRTRRRERLLGLRARDRALRGQSLGAVGDAPGLVGGDLRLEERRLGLRHCGRDGGAARVELTALEIERRGREPRQHLPRLDAVAHVREKRVDRLPLDERLDLDPLDGHHEPRGDDPVAQGRGGHLRDADGG